MVFEGVAYDLEVGWLAAEVRNVTADVTALASFYDGDPAAGGELIGEVGFIAAANSIVAVGVDWLPIKAGMVDIYVVISGADPAEFTTGNNRAMIQVQVGEANGRVFLAVIRR